MITDKICYIHLRNQNRDGNYAVKGGATIAWVVESETGNVVIGKPARCLADNPKTGKVGDIFTRKQGREEAFNKIVFEAPIATITREELVNLATSQAMRSLNFQDLAPSAIKTLQTVAAEGISNGVENFMGSGWYEQVVRVHFILNSDNSLDFVNDAMPLLKD